MIKLDKRLDVMVDAEKKQRELLEIIRVLWFALSLVGFLCSVLLLAYKHWLVGAVVLLGTLILGNRVEDWVDSYSSS